jgi:uncharacterized protein YdiU (UPF0061 family)
MSTYNTRMAAKLGLQSPDTALVNQLLTIMARSGADWTNTFRWVRLWLAVCVDMGNTIRECQAISSKR